MTRILGSSLAFLLLVVASCHGEKKERPATPPAFLTPVATGAACNPMSAVPCPGNNNWVCNNNVCVERCGSGNPPPLCGAGEFCDGAHCRPLGAGLSCGSPSCTPANKATCDATCSSVATPYLSPAGPTAGAYCDLGLGQCVGIGWSCLGPSACPPGNECNASTLHCVAAAQLPCNGSASVCRPGEVCKPDGDGTCGSHCSMPGPAACTPATCSATGSPPADYGDACGCGGTIQCDGTCSSTATPAPEYGEPCGCGGTIQCDGSCDKPAPSGVGDACGCGGTIQCNGACSKADCGAGLVCMNGSCVQSCGHYQEFCCNGVQGYPSGDPLTPNACFGSVGASLGCFNSRCTACRQADYYTILDYGTGSSVTSDGSGLVRDDTTHLVWMRYDQMLPKSTTPHADAVAYCQGKGMRLPTQTEAVTISGSSYDPCYWPANWTAETSTSAGGDAYWSISSNGQALDHNATCATAICRSWALCVK